MRHILLVIVMSWSVLALSEEPPHAAFPVAAGAPVESTLSEADQQELRILQLEEQVEQLQMQATLLQASLLQCQAPATRQARDERRRAVERKRRPAPVVKKAK